MFDSQVLRKTPDVKSAWQNVDWSDAVLVVEVLNGPVWPYQTASPCLIFHVQNLEEETGWKYPHVRLDVSEDNQEMAQKRNRIVEVEFKLDWG